MKAEELMVGDWVIAHRIECVGDGGQFQEWKQIGYITRINEDTIYVMFDKQEEDWEEIDVKDIHPIPLTPEILEKNGFVLKPDGWLWCEEEGSEEQNYIFIQFRKGCDEVRIVELNFVNNVLAKFRTIQFVHELQHVLILCNIDKKIVL